VAESPIALHIDPEALVPLVRAIVAEVLSQVEAGRQQVPENGKLAFSEEEAARMLGLESHVLRDERRRGRIGASSIVGRRIRYTRADLMEYLSKRRVNLGEQI
jgi:hypothetical protein